MEEVIKTWFHPKSLIVRNKKSIGLGWHYRTQHELVCFAIKGKRPLVWNGGYGEADVWTLARVPVNKYEHPTQKPISICERAIRNSSNE